LIEGLELFGLGSSWGGYESLVIASYPERIRSATSWDAPGRTLRIHAGLEDPSDLIADLEEGLRRFKRAIREST
jgi:cystathionine beta-lyase